MSLLDTASLLLTPNAYKEGKLYSVIPSDGSGDFTFTRATTATRVNSDGLVELVPYNLLQRSEEFDNGAWTKSASSITANATTAPNGTLTADKLISTSVSSSHLIYQNLGSVGDTRVISCFVKKAEYRYVNLQYGTAYARFDFDTLTFLGGTSNTYTDEGNGWYRISTVLTATVNARATILIPDNSGNISYVGDDVSGTFIWGFQANEGTNALPYQKTETRLNIPRLDYSLGGCPNILLEPQRTNLALQSSSFDSATWGKANATITANTTTSPSGVIDADKIVETATTALHLTFQYILPTSTGSFTSFVYAKKSERNWVGLINYTGVSSGDCIVWFDLNSGTIGTITNGAGSSSTTAAIENAGNGWYKCSMTINKTSTSSGSFAILPSTANNVLSYAGDGTSGVYLWGAQLEVGSYATSYIPTTTASVTRNADVCVGAGNTATFNSTEGVLYVELSSNSIATFKNMSINSDGSNRINFFIYNSAVTANFDVGGVTQASISYTIPSVTSFNKFAFSYKLNEFKLFVNGTQRGSTDTSGIVPPINTFNKFSFNDSFTNNFYGNVKDLQIFTTALTDDQLEALTGEGFNTYAEMASYYNYTLQ